MSRLDRTAVVFACLGIVLLLLLIGTVFFAVFDYLAFRRSHYMIRQDSAMYYTSTYKEQDGCLTFKETKLNEDVTICGKYQIVTLPR